MRHFSSEALLLDVQDLHDRDRIVSFLTREWGKKKGVARGARRKYSRYAGQLQPLAKVRVAWFEKEGRELVRIGSVELVRSAHRLQADLEGILLGSYLADHLLHFVQENEASDHPYRLLDSVLEALMSGVDRNLAGRYFEAWMLRLSGIFPAPRECPHCGSSFSARGAALPASGEALLCRDCVGETTGSLLLGTGELEFLNRIGREPLRKMALRPPTADVLERVEEICSRIRRSFLQHELKSYEVMRQTLSGI